MAGLFEKERVGVAERIGRFERNQHGAGIHLARAPWDIEESPGLSVVRHLDFTVVESQEPGALVMVVSGAHGNEATCVMVAKKITDTALDAVRRGTFVSLSEMNQEGILQKKREVPYMGIAGPLADLNRSFIFGKHAPIATLTRIQRHALAIIYRVLGAHEENKKRLAAKPDHVPLSTILLDAHTEGLNDSDDVLPWTKDYPRPYASFRHDSRG